MNTCFAVSYQPCCRNYYNFNPVNERLQYLPDEVVAKLLDSTGPETTKDSVPHFCDLGCNEGDLSIGMHEMLSLAIRGSSAPPPKRLKASSEELPNDAKTNAVPVCGLLGVDVDSELIRRGNDKAKSRGLSAAVQFEVCDLSVPGDDALQRYLSAAGATQFSCIFCFSMTMWIHLNNGDDGLKQFLR
jgi:hypothetical protein